MTQEDHGPLPMRPIPPNSALRNVRKSRAGTNYMRMVRALHEQTMEWKRRAISARVGEFLSTRALKNIGDKAIRMEITQARPGNGEMRMLMGINECVIHGLSQSDFIQILMTQFERMMFEFLPACRNSPGYVQAAAMNLLKYSPLAQMTDMNMLTEMPRYVPPGTDPLPNLPSNVPRDLGILGRELHGLLNLLSQRIRNDEYWKQCGFPLQFATRSGLMTVTLDTTHPYLE
jgi:hypothetical protein